MSGVRVSGAWRTPAITSVKVAGTWRTAATVSVKINGVWRLSTFAGPPSKPTMSFQNSTPQFSITNYSPSLVYAAIPSSGSGTATLNTSTGVYTISGGSSQYYFNVTARYAIGAPESLPGFMERKPYSFSCRQVTYTQAYGCNCGLVGGNCYCVDCATGGVKSNQCGCTAPNVCTVGSIGTVVCQTCYQQVCCSTICDVLINEPGYTNSGGAWWRAG